MSAETPNILAVSHGILLDRVALERASQLKWDLHFIDLSLLHSKMSKDPNTRVGSVIVGPDREVRSMGFNGFPRGIADTAERLADRDFKNRCMVHAERNAILAAARVGIPLRGCTLYLAATDDSGSVWGGPPCTGCAIEIIQAGIVAVASRPFKSGPSKWRADTEEAGRWLKEAGVEVREVNPIEVHRCQPFKDAHHA